MASYDLMGSYLVAEALAEVPSGAVHRAVATAGGSFERHVLLATFSDELRKAGLASRWAEAGRVAERLEGARGFGANYRLEPEEPFHLCCDYVPGRTLAQVLARAKREQLPLGVDQALTVVQGLAQALLQLHRQQLHHGALTPHSLWISYEGSTLLLDAPMGAILDDLSNRAPALRTALAPYRRDGRGTVLQRDLYALGAILYEMLTLEPLPALRDLPKALERPELKQTLDGTEIPGEVVAFLKLLLAGDPPTAEGFEAALERVLYSGDNNPTTFNIAFLMHTLFPAESRTDAESVQREQISSFAQYLPAGSGQPVLAPEKAPRRAGVFFLVAGVVVAVAVLAGVLTSAFHQGGRQQQVEQNIKTLQDQLAQLEREKAANDAKLADIARRETAQKALVAMFGKQATEGGTEQIREAARKDLAAANQKTRELAEERAEAMYYQKQLQKRQEAAKAK